MIRQLYYRLPPSLRFVVRRLWYAPTDLLDWVLGRRDKLSPPRGLIYTGSGDFRKQGAAMVEIFKQAGGLRPQHRVLDIGSGIGRIAVPLTGYLREGSYEGFDVVALGVNWCQKNISKSYPHFRFTYTGLSNDLYRSDGANPATFIFPYAEGTFDFGFAVSVFTHMLPEEVEQYLGQIRRVLKPGAKFTGTFFLMREEDQEDQSGRADFAFHRQDEHYWLMDTRVKAANVAYRESWLWEKIKVQGMKVRQVHYGYWRGGSRGDSLDFQDIIVLENTQD